MAELTLDQLAAQIARSLVPELGAASQAIGAELVNVLAPYPEAPGHSATSRRWYERGYGWRYSHGGGDPVSEQMNRRWDIQPRGIGAEVVNLASYSGKVQSAAGQLDLFKAIGWKTDEQAIEQIDRDGVIVNEVEDAIRRTLGNLVEP